MAYRLGIDVGGTNTDAVILDENNRVLAQTKTHTTEDIGSGIATAIQQVFADTEIAKEDVTIAMLGTTQCTNAIVERKKLISVGVLRVAAPATHSIPPFTDWDPELVAAIRPQTAIVSGGHEYDGRLIAAVDEDEVRTVLEQWRGKVDAVAIVGAFSALNADQEEQVRAVVTQVYGKDFPVSLSSAIGSLGLIERENATVLNSALFAVIEKVTSGFANSLRDVGVTDASLFLCQNDGTLMALDYAQKYPIFTIGSGPTNSIRGAAFLSELKGAIVLDIGGTTSDLGVLVNGFPRESSIAVNVGGVKTNFRMPDINSIGIGGGTVVHQHDDGTFTVGPDSVGYRITEKALVFGGDVLTLTDVAVRLGKANLGDPEKVAHVDLDLAQKVEQQVKQMLEDAIDSMKTQAGDVDLVLVGGGAIVAPATLNGVKQIHQDQLGAVANAIGATIAQVGGEYEKMYSYDAVDREDALADATEAAKQQALKAGARAETVKLVEMTETAIAYAPGNTTRVKAKVVGEIELDTLG
ncbi:hydantoinase/oxoprolinase family protein [Ligilactobacillus saerimneri]|uniref:hydantoinase/oxoprolinase family protein n=1 Tax=Ligilactobacillus saerimneri TaxID=228229 RepID=UPI0024B15BE7|nr:hydantoinase/oxoprolinase family protein [Ligilactobacillus saerimneri]MDI9206017.1 hydantoinase/oxoprolinase family protein [Ligilactobacillus saerimneri]